jgi:hypothetical protein
MQPCFPKVRRWRGEASWNLLHESGLREVVIEISNVKWVSAEETSFTTEEEGVMVSSYHSVFLLFRS